MHTSSSRLITPIAIGTLGTLVAHSALAQTTMTGNIKMVRTGWSDDYFAVVTVESMPNPARCKRSDGYLLHKSMPGYNTLLSAALTAYSVHRRVELTAHNSECVLDWPKLIGINLIQD